MSQGRGSTSADRPAVNIAASARLGWCQ